jgi:hypothetical protein
VVGARAVQRHVLYLGGVNDDQEAAWCRTIEAFDEDGQRVRHASRKRLVAMLRAYSRRPVVRNAVQMPKSVLRLVVVRGSWRDGLWPAASHASDQNATHSK